MNHYLRPTLAMILFIILLMGSSPVQAVQEPASDRPATQPDNTKANKRDRSQPEVTADQQSEKSSDREITRQIRRSIVKDKTLSSYAHNIKIITQNGAVTLKGPVRSEEERKSVETKAVEVAGAANVKNQTEVVPEPASKK